MVFWSVFYFVDLVFILRRMAATGTLAGAWVLFLYETVVLSRFRTRTHCEPGLRTRPALHFRSLVVPFLRWVMASVGEFHGIDLTDGIYKWLGLRWGCWGISFCELALVMMNWRALFSFSRPPPEHAECNKKDCSVYIFILDLLCIASICLFVVCVFRVAPHGLVLELDCKDMRQSCMAPSVHVLGIIDAIRF
jgi:hypothetical protein